MSCRVALPQRESTDFNTQFISFLDGLPITWGFNNAPGH